MKNKNKISAKLKLIFLFLLSILLLEILYLSSSQKGRSETCDNFKTLGSKQQCWEELISKTLKQEGLDAAFKLVDDLYTNEPQFAADCHSFTHQLGEKAYQLFSLGQNISLSSKTSYCGFGFYHSFMESLLRSTGDLSQARQFCDYVGRQEGQNELSRLACFHGIGHGLLEDIPNPSLKGNAQAIIKQPLDTCSKLAKSEVEDYRCASGVFNVLAIYYQNPKAGLKVENGDPYLICNSQTKKYPKKACYDQMNSLVLSLTNGSLLSAAKFAEDIEDDEFAKEAMHGISGAYGQSNVGKINYDDVVKMCQNVHQRLESDCIQGFLLGMLEGGRPGEEHVEGQKFCNSNLLNVKEKISCFNDLVWNVNTTNPKKLSDLCNNLDRQYRQNCNEH